MYTQRKVCACVCAGVCLRVSKAAGELLYRTQPRVRFIHRNKHTHTHTHTPGCSCNPNCSSAKSSAQPHKHSLTTLEAELNCSVIAPPLHTHTTGILFTAVSHILLTQIDCVWLLRFKQPVACFIRPAGFILPAKSHVENSFHLLTSLGNVNDFYIYGIFLLPVYSAHSSCLHPRTVFVFEMTARRHVSRGQRAEFAYLSMMTGSDGVSFLLPQLFLSQHRLQVGERRGGWGGGRRGVGVRGGRDKGELVTDM